MQNGENRPENGRPQAGRLARFRDYSGSLRSDSVAFSLGWVLMASIIAPCLLGIWLDKRFKTTFWTPVLFLIGATWGFYDLFRTVTALSKRKQDEMQQRRAGGAARASAGSASAPSRSASPSAAPSEAAPDTVEQDRPRPRLFDVPPPPVASFDIGAPTPSGTRNPVESVDDDLPEDNAQLIRRLLDEPDEDDLDEQNGLQSKDAPP
jgi:F0F1-type ATP synthase assembly protein I